jgi:hypothetical protein
VFFFFLKFQEPEDVLILVKTCSCSVRQTILSNKDSCVKTDIDFTYKVTVYKKHAQLSTVSDHLSIQIQRILTAGGSSKHAAIY